MKLDIDKIITEAAGKSAVSARDSHVRLAAKLKKLGVTITHHAINKWHERQNIQGQHMASLAELAVEEHRKLDLTQYLIH